MKNIPKISVVVPVCNVEAYVEQCVKSVLDQTLREIEVICVDDGSTDNSLQILYRIAQTDNRVKVIAKKNTGYGNSVNIGIENSNGEYLAIIESDDFIDPNMFKELYALSENGTVDVIKGNFWDYYDNETCNGISVVNRERNNIPVINKSFNITQFPQLLWGHPSIWSALYRLDFLKKNNITFMEEPGGGWVDNPFFFETLYLAQSIKWTQKPYYYYRKTNANSSSNKQVDLTLPMRRMIDNLNVLKKYECNDEEILKIAYARALMYLRGVFLERHWGLQYKKIREAGHNMMKELKKDVILNNFNAADQKLYFEYLLDIESYIPKSGKILIYNWIQFDNPNNYGGGVNIYCRNLIDAILNNRPDIQVYFLSSGWAYDDSTTDCYLRTTHNIFGKRCLSFEIVNSPVPAAQNVILNNPVCAFQNSQLKDTIDKFISDCGGFDVIHFNNIEGLSLDVLDLKKKYFNTKFIYSLHNYIPFCITGFYFKRNEKCNCDPNHSANDCINCTNVGRRTDLCNEIILRAVAGSTNTNKRIDSYKWAKKMGFDKLDEISSPELLKDFCNIAINKINNNIDCVLAVAERVKNLAIFNGIRKDILHTSYIGTKVAEFQKGKSIHKKNNYLKIAYLGSDIKFIEKGYPFLIQSLSNLDAKYANKIDLFLTTTNGNVSEIKKMLAHFHSVQVKVGYKHSELRDMLADVDLGIIPVLWEDNLPQIAIEMVSMGVPILCSNFGGASELCYNDMFVFNGGDSKQLNEKIIYFLNNRDKLDDYWLGHNGLVTMKDHLKELENFFGFSKSQQIKIPFEIFAEFNQSYQNMLMFDDNNYKFELDLIKNSMSFKFSEKIAFVPRTIRKIKEYYRVNGLISTLKKIKEKI